LLRIRRRDTKDFTVENLRVIFNLIFPGAEKKRSRFYAFDDEKPQVCGITNLEEVREELRWTEKKDVSYSRGSVPYGAVTRYRMSEKKRKTTGLFPGKKEEEGER